MYAHNVEAREKIFPIHSFTRKCYIGREILNNNLCFFMNIYSPCNLELSRKLWLELVEVKIRLGPGSWCYGGDFNSIRNSRERK